MIEKPETVTVNVEQTLPSQYSDERGNVYIHESDPDFDKAIVYDSPMSPDNEALLNDHT